MAGLLEEIVVMALGVGDAPGGHHLGEVRAGAAAAGEGGARGRVEREREQVLGLGVVGDEPAAALEEQVREADHVDREDQDEHHVEDPLPVLLVRRRVLLGAHRGAERLVAAPRGQRVEALPVPVRQVVLEARLHRPDGERCGRVGGERLGRAG